MSQHDALAALRADLRSRWERGQPLPLADYLRDAPWLAADPDAVLSLIADEIALRRQSGESLSAEEYLSRVPGLASTFGPVHRAALRRLDDPDSTTAPHADSSPDDGTTDDAGRERTRHADDPAAIPGYEVLETLGRGAMGVVYKVRDKKLGRVAALKVIRSAEHAGSGEIARFLVEARAVAAVQHPHIVQILEIGQHRGLPYFTLEFLAGGTLAARLKERLPTPGDAARLVEQLARAMHFAHSRGVIHRDLKPSNILLAEGPDAPLSQATAKVSDFGLAKHGGDDAGTRTGAILGTPAYMPPEQAMGEGKNVGPAADIYSLGAILYEALAGRPPFVAAAGVDTLLQVATMEPPAPRALRPDVPRDLETICLKCLHKDPARRYRSAEELADDLRRFREGAPILARPVGMAERAAKWARRRPAIVALLAALVIVGLTGAALVFVQWRRAEAAAVEARG
ncbi:MAG: serine/threonine protein kinase, partial [Gemmataceae bacterium]|nr:serine/threonine protein kinase [Gemmataceae bacterium]